jgi:hypothetical protein
MLSKQACPTVRKTVLRIDSLANCSERKQMTRIRINYRQHPKPWNPWKRTR